MSGMRLGPSNPRVISRGIWARGKVSFSASVQWRWNRVTTHSPKTTMAIDTPSHWPIMPVQPYQGNSAPEGDPIQNPSITQRAVDGKMCHGTKGKTASAH